MHFLKYLLILLPLFGIGCFGGDGIGSRDALPGRLYPNTEITTTTRSNSLMPIPNTFLDPQKFASTNSLPGLALRVKGSALSVSP
ncbi:MAG: hypothetical protein WCW31_04800, partial [Patescibacteria group bacterium]